LAFQSEEYWEIRRELLKANLIQTGRGRGGSVARTTEAPEKKIEVPKGYVENEKDLYKPLEKWLDDNYGHDPKESGDFFKVKITGGPSGHKRDSGQWSRPDLVMVQVNKFDFLQGCTLEVTTFEVKQHADEDDLRSVYEAAAHTRWAHNAYLVIEVPNAEYPVNERTTTELARFNIGLLAIYRKNGGYECIEKLEPIRHEPDPKELNQLLKIFFQEEEILQKQYKSFIGK